MGNIVEKVSSHKVEALLLAAIASAGFLIHRQHQEKEELKAIFLKTIQSKESGLKEFENALNQVYLKEHV